MKYGCVFCDYAGPSPILHEFGDVFVIEPMIPVTPGHLLVVPTEHVEDAATSPSLTARVFEIAGRIAGYDAGPSFNLITSAGKAATQTVRHLHVHVIPRRAGDGIKLPWSA